MAVPLDRQDAYPTFARKQVMQEGVFRRRQLPHWDVDDKPVFITACLAGSLSAKGLKRIRQYRTDLDNRECPKGLTLQEWETRKSKLVFRMVDQMLDYHSPVRYLEDDNQAETVSNALLHFAGARYELLAFVVMPSHYHWLFRPLESWVASLIEQQHKNSACNVRTPRERITQSIQSFTANECNRIRGASGTYWQGETFDHWVRDDDELSKIIHYIEQNPVKAGLVSTAEEYAWSSAAERFRKQIDSIQAQS